MTAPLNGRVQRTVLRALDRTLVENRELRRAMFETEKRPPVPRHCGLCGRRVCECGLEDWIE